MCTDCGGSFVSTVRHKFPNTFEDILNHKEFVVTKIGIIALIGVHFYFVEDMKLKLIPVPKDFTL